MNMPMRHLPALLLLWLAQDPDPSTLADELEKKFDRLKSLEAEFALSGLDSKEEKISYERMVLKVDFETRRSHLVVHAVPAEGTFHFFMDQWVSAVWDGKDKRLRLDARRFMEPMEKHLDRMKAELLGLLGRVPDRTLRASMNLTLEARTAERRGQVRCSTGIGHRRANWFREARAAAKGNVKVTDEEVSFDLPERRKTLVLDRQTGFPRLISVRNEDGTTAEMRLKRFSDKAEIPVPEMLSDFKPASLGVEGLKGHLQGLAVVLVGSISDVGDAWAEVQKAGRAEDALALITRWTAGFVEGARVAVIRETAQSYIGKLLDSGVDLAKADYAAAKDDFVELFKDRDIASWWLDQVKEAVRSNGAEKKPDTGFVARALSAAMSESRVEKERSKNETPIERIFKEEWDHPKY